MTFNSSPHIAFDQLPDSTQYQLQAIPVLSSKFGYKHKNFTLDDSYSQADLLG